MGREKTHKHVYIPTCGHKAGQNHILLRVLQKKGHFWDVILVSPARRKSALKNMFSKHLGVGGMPTVVLGVKFGVNFGGGGWSPGETRPKSLQEKVAYEFAEKFVGNSPRIRQTSNKTKPKSALQNLEINVFPSLLPNVPDLVDGLPPTYTHTHKNCGKRPRKQGEL